MNRLATKGLDSARIEPARDSVPNGAPSDRTPSAEATGRLTPLKLLRFAAVQERTGLSRSTIWRLERGSQFPKHRRISANAVAWVETEVIAWIREKVDV